jgi:ADP-ribose pyrophosphatase YjhB (NUDIX family)
VEIKLVADVFVRADGKALLVRYAHPERYDGQRGWFLPDDYLRHGEHPADAAKRILADQVGIVDIDVILDHIESFDGDDWHLIFHFTAGRQRAESPRVSDEIAEARWFALTDLPAPEDVAHDGWALDLIAAMSSPTAAVATDRSR